MIKPPVLFSKEWAIAATKEITQASENWQYLLAVYNHEAKIKRAQYEAYKAQGFSDEQCIALIK